MSHAIGFPSCAVIGCHRRADVHADGRCVHGRCPEHELSALRGAFTSTAAPDLVLGPRSVEVSRASGGSRSLQAAGSVALPAS